MESLEGQFKKEVPKALIDEVDKIVDGQLEMPQEMIDELMSRAAMTEEEARKEAAKRLKAKKGGLQLDESAYQRDHFKKEGMRKEADKNL